METNIELNAEQLDALKKVELDIFNEVDRVCKLHDIKYSLVFGMFLGAVQHKGFIPWDDDIDIAMAREEYIKSREIAIKDLQEEYFFVDYRTHKDYGHSFAKIMAKGTLMKEYSIQRNHSPDGIDIDVFIYDSSPNTERLKEKQFNRCKRLKKQLPCRSGYCFGQKGIRGIGYRLRGKLLSIIPKFFYQSL